MPLYRDYIYPYLVDKLGNPSPIQIIRQQIIPLAQGNVLEIGVGSGTNLLYYDATRVSKLYALEPNKHMIRLAQKRERKTNLNIEYLDLSGEHIPLNDNSMNTVVSTFTLCTLSVIEAAIEGINRVLKPSGQFIFFELGLAPDAAVQRWQRRLEPICQRLFQGLYLTRNIPFLLTQDGFQIIQRRSAYLASFPKSLSYCWWGTAMIKTEMRSD